MLGLTQRQHLPDSYRFPKPQPISFSPHQFLHPNEPSLISKGITYFSSHVT